MLAVTLHQIFINTEVKNVTISPADSLEVKTAVAVFSPASPVLPWLLEEQRCPLLAEPDVSGPQQVATLQLVQVKQKSLCRQKSEENKHLFATDWPLH